MTRAHWLLTIAALALLAAYSGHNLRAVGAGVDAARAGGRR